MKVALAAVSERDPDRHGVPVHDLPDAIPLHPHGVAGSKGLAAGAADASGGSMLGGEAWAERASCIAKRLQLSQVVQRSPGLSPSRCASSTCHRQRPLRA